MTMIRTMAAAASRHASPRSPRGGPSTTTTLRSLLLLLSLTPLFLGREGGGGGGGGGGGPLACWALAAEAEVGEDGTVLYGGDEEEDAGDVLGPDGSFSITVVNSSPHRADVHWDDGWYGSNVGTVEANGGSMSINTFDSHSFFVVRHGVREGLFDPATDGQVKFTASSSRPGQRFAIPTDAAPSSDPCRDRFTACRKTAETGGCGRSPGWMIVHCCESCDEELDARRLIDPAVRCDREAFLNTTEAAWGPGDLNRLFESWATEEAFRRYEPEVLSSPGGRHGGADGPWVVTFGAFVTDAECDDLIRGGQNEGFERSTDQGRSNAVGEQEKVVSQTRTSSNAWCTGACERLPGVVSITKRIEAVTGVPKSHYESFQILEYEKGQFYRRHHDSSAGKDDQASGHRILTFFLYLTDVEEGGETHFSTLGLSVKPKRGKALVWPSVLDDDPDTWDSRMYHEAKDVIKGKKMAANHWIHQYDFETPNFWGCTGSFS